MVSRPRGYGLMGYASGFTIWRKEDVDPKKIRAEGGGSPPSGQPIIPFPTGRNLFLVATRHFVPGYLHLVPSGRPNVSTCPHFRSQITPLAQIREQPARRSLPEFQTTGRSREDEDERREWQGSSETDKADRISSSCFALHASSRLRSSIAVQSAMLWLSVTCD